MIFQGYYFGYFSVNWVCTFLKWVIFKSNACFVCEKYFFMFCENFHHYQDAIFKNINATESHCSSILRNLWLICVKMSFCRRIFHNFPKQSTQQVKNLFHSQIYCAHLGILKSYPSGLSIERWWFQYRRKVWLI